MTVALKVFLLFIIALTLLCPGCGYDLAQANTASAAYQQLAKVKLKINVKKKSKKSTIKVSGKTGKYYTVVTSVNGQSVSTLTASKKGSFKVSVPLIVGNNTITVQASNGVAAKTVFKRVTRSKPKAKKTTEKSLASFSKSLVASGDDERSKVKKIYDWVTANIKYDYDKYNDDDAWGEAEVTEVFDNRKGVCSEYAHLLGAMLDDVGIESEKVSGVADGLGGWGDHAWNEIKLNGETLYMDSTWDAGDDPDDYEYFLIPEKCMNVNHNLHYSDEYSNSEQESYVANNSAYFDAHCPNLKSRFVSSDD